AIIKAIQSLNQATLDEVIQKLGELRDGKSPAAEKKTLRTEDTAGNFASSAMAKVSPVAEKVSATPTLKVAETPNGGGDPAEIWENVYAKIPNTKAFVRNSAAIAHALPSEGRNFVLGFPLNQKSEMDILGTPTNRKLIEGLLREVSGRDWTLKLISREDLQAKEEVAAPESASDYANNNLIREALEI